MEHQPSGVWGPCSPLNLDLKLDELSLQPKLSKRSLVATLSWCELKLVGSLAEASLSLAQFSPSLLDLFLVFLMFPNTVFVINDIYIRYRIILKSNELLYLLQIVS